MIDLKRFDYSALIFDCDGTLAVTAPLHFQCMLAAVQQQGFEITQDWYSARVGLSRRDLFEDFVASRGVPLNVDAAVEVSSAHYPTVVHQAKPITATISTARHHFGKVPMAVASGAEDAAVLATLNSVGISDLFSHVVTVSSVPIGKPAPDLFYEAARRLQTSPSDCLVFEDSDEGLEAASTAGMPAVDVRTL